MALAKNRYKGIETTIEFYEQVPLDFINTFMNFGCPQDQQTKFIQVLTKSNNTCL